MDNFYNINIEYEDGKIIENDTDDELYYSPEVYGSVDNFFDVNVFSKKDDKNKLPDTSILKWVYKGNYFPIIVFNNDTEEYSYHVFIKSKDVCMSTTYKDGFEKYGFEDVENICRLVKYDSEFFKYENKIDIKDNKKIDYKIIDNIIKVLNNDFYLDSDTTVNITSTGYVPLVIETKDIPRPIRGRFLYYLNENDSPIDALNIYSYNEDEKELVQAMEVGYCNSFELSLNEERDELSFYHIVRIDSDEIYEKHLLKNFSLEEDQSVSEFKDDWFKSFKKELTYSFNNYVYNNMCIEEKICDYIHNALYDTSINNFVEKDINKIFEDIIETMDSFEEDRQHNNKMKRLEKIIKQMEEYRERFKDEEV